MTFGGSPHHPAHLPLQLQRKQRMAWFYEIRNSNNAVLTRDGGFATQDAAKIAGREDVKKMKNMRQPDRPDVGRIPRQLFKDRFQFSKNKFNRATACNKRPSP
jgi:hypothetical protein